MAVLNGVRTGVLRAGERVTLTDPKGRRHSVLLASGGTFHTTKGAISHDALIGGPDGNVVVSAGGVAYVAFRPLLEEFTVTMPRGAAVIYPKDAAQILVQTDIFPGARVLEAGVGSGSLSMHLLRAIGSEGRLYSYERRADFAQIATKNVEAFFGAPHPAWEVRVGDLVETIGPEPVAVLEHPSGVEVNLILNAPNADAPNILMDVPHKHPGITHFALLCPDILAAKAALEAAGIGLSGGPVQFGPGAQGIFLRDPDHNVIELHQRG